MITIALLPASLATSKTHLTTLAQDVLTTALLVAAMEAALPAVKASISEN